MNKLIKTFIVIGCILFGGVLCYHQFVPQNNRALLLPSPNSLSFMLPIAISYLALIFFLIAGILSIRQLYKEVKMSGLKAVLNIQSLHLWMGVLVLFFVIFMIVFTVEIKFY